LLASEANWPCDVINGVAIMIALALLADANGGGQIEQIASTFGVDWQHLIAQIISFCIVCALLQKFAYRPVLVMLEERRRRIGEGLANAEKIRTELATTESRRAEVLAEASVQAIKLIQDARAAAAIVKQQEIQKATAAAEEIIAKGRESVERERERMLAELKREVGRLILQTTEAVTGKILTPEDQTRLAEETVKPFAV
jgi:F-type H+-transporting ATPase subunit b